VGVAGSILLETYHVPGGSQVGTRYASRSFLNAFDSHLTERHSEFTIPGHNGCVTPTISVQVGNLVEAGESCGDCLGDGNPGSIRGWFGGLLGGSALVGFPFDEDEQLPLLYGFGDPIKLCRLILTARPFSARGPRPSARTRPSSCFGSTFEIKAIVFDLLALYSNSVTVFFAGSPATEPTSLVKKLGGSDPRRRRRWAAEKPLSVGSLPPKI